MKPVLSHDAIYLGDNGRCFCGRLDHAGMTAHFTGRGLSGHPVHEVTEADQREARRMGVTLACETCTAEVTRARELMQQHNVPDVRQQRIEWERQGLYGPEV